MRITIETNQPLSESEIEILQLLLSKRAGSEQPSPAKKKPATPKQATKTPQAQETPTEAPSDPQEEEPDEAASDEAAKETKPAKEKPAKEKPAKADDADLDKLLNEATEIAMELMNQGETDKVKAALSATGVKKVSAIDSVEDASKFLKEIKSN